MSNDALYMNVVDILRKIHEIKKYDIWEPESLERVQKNYSNDNYRFCEILFLYKWLPINVAMVSPSDS